MKKLLAILLSLLLLTGCTAETSTTEPVEAPAAEAPAEEQPAADDSAAETEEPVYLGNFSAQTLTGETLDQSFFVNAELTVINIWATYCGPCKQEMPILGELDRELDNVQVLGVVTDVIDQNAEPDPSQVELALDLLEAAACDYPCLILNQDLAYLGFASLQAVPATLFVDSEGCLVGMGIYGALNEDGWYAIIEERLEMAQQ